MPSSTSSSLRTLLISTYDLGRQPFGLASAAAWMRRAGAGVVCRDLAVDRLDEESVRSADLVAFHIPMHTATRLAARAARRVREINPSAHLCFYGLYAPMNESFLRSLGAGTILGGEFEEGLASLVGRLRSRGSGVTAQTEPVVSLARQRFLVPDRSGLPPSGRYARLHMPDGSVRAVGTVEASRGCKHRCRHCPVVPVYDGAFRIVQAAVVLEDIRRQVDAGAEHITFGDPDFLNGIGHALAIARGLHREHPGLTYDVTVKIEHILDHRGHLPELRETGCLLVTSAVESIDDEVLDRLEKGHTRAGFEEAARLQEEAGITLNPTFIPFTPWTTSQGYQRLLRSIRDLDLVSHVAPVQLTLRLLVPGGSRLLELPDVRERIVGYDEEGLAHAWVHEDPEVDRLHDRARRIVETAAASNEPRERVFSRLLDLSGVAEAPRPARIAVPYLTEPWYC